MFKHIYLILGATFLLGFVSGVILYLQSATGKEGAGDIETSDEISSITARAYGGCERSRQCASYRIEDAKTYTYIANEQDGVTPRSTGVLERSNRQELKTELDDTDLANLTSPFIGTCPTATDGLAYRYTIMKEGVEYVFDSCTVLLTDIPLFDTLEGYFDIFASVYEAQNK